MWTVTTSFRVTVIGVDLERCFSTGVSGFLEEDALSEPTVVDFRPSGAFLQRFRPAELRINFVDFPPLCFEFLQGESERCLDFEELEAATTEVGSTSSFETTCLLNVRKKKGREGGRAERVLKID